MPLAHETWFVEDDVASDWGFLGEAATLALLAVAVALVVGVRLVARRHPGIEVPALARLAPWMPFALRMHLAVSLVGLVSLGAFLSPAMDLPTTAFGILLGAAMVLVAAALATGWRTRVAAWLLVALGPIGMLEFGAVDVLQRVDLLGMALFLVFAGPGRWSADHETGRERDPDAIAVARGVWALRVAAGSAFIVVALVEKLVQPDLALALLEEHPDFNVVSGLGVSDLEFVRVAGAVEVLFGLLVISGALPQLVVVAVGVPFNVTLWFFGSEELIGHLPVYGAMLALLVLGSDPRLRAVVPGLWPFRSPARAGGRAPRSRP